MSNEFTSKFKLNHQYQFDACIRKGRRFKIYPFSCFILENDCQHNRLGLLISKRWNKLAVQRNLLKRWLRENFRVLGSTAKVDIVIIPYKNTKIVYSQVEKLWNVLNLG